ncbi:alpha/beta hydrolase [Myroides odoratimimus]|uniref:Peptidase S9 prolyl oligopeptidase catalytic domain-containing protein n=1 Tax=Myroides odoratimimus CIP 101113 TaxID=883154 RepID=A0AAV3F4R3_9FLAO|nr:alpha/beta hydrolase [Myroides odoratimimus]EHO13063.1 hypothetical protein HMPREF9715_01470 [Myroides odoratimimus CIP 101113]
MKKTIKFKALYWDIAADLFFPANFDENKKYSVIISTHPIGSCKEQTSGNVYGQALADAGFIVLVPDASFQGESGGNLRYLEDPSFRVEDYSYACDYLVTLPFVDENRIGALGICGAGGYVINATMKERRIKAVATLTGANYGRVMREFGDPIANLEAIAAQRTAEARGETLRIDQGLYPTYDMAKEAHADIDILEATEYYRTSRGEKTNGVNKTLFSHNATAITWDAYNLAEKLLTQPLLVIVGSKPGAFGAYRDGFEIIRRAASKKKELVVVNGWSHYDLYDKPEPVKIALDKLIPFYKENL